jgi:hypothetical protein
MKLHQLESPLICKIKRPERWRVGTSPALLLYRKMDLTLNDLPFLS